MPLAFTNCVFANSFCILFGSLSPRAVLLPPYHPRMNRPHLDENGNRVLAKPREAFKVEFDERVFGTRYF